MFRYSWTWVCIIALLQCIFGAAAFANPQLSSNSSIYASRASLQDNAKLQAFFALIPTLDRAAIDQMFTLYKKEKAGSDLEANNARTVHFINAHWGVLQNPFAKYSRPAKLFVFPSGAIDPHHLVPVVREADDNHTILVFDQRFERPYPLFEWLKLVKQTYKTADITLAICDRYASTPSESCESANYLHELTIAEKTDRHHVRADSLASKQTISEIRDPNRDWREYASFYQAKFAATSGGSIYSTAISWTNEAAKKELFSTVRMWENDQVIQANFEKIRDIRFLPDPKKSSFLRRISWLYPDDGCWTRASAVVRGLFGIGFENPMNQYVRPAKLFAFGNLCVNTKHSPYGSVSWWYHTTPVIRDAVTNEIYVIDPAVEPKKPLTIADWIASVSANDGACKSSHRSHSVSTINICGAYGSGPYDQCDTVTSYGEANHVFTQSTYLSAERDRQQSLGRDADKVLGDMPPWIT